jgi:hypothetical protein
MATGHPHRPSGLYMHRNAQRHFRGRGRCSGLWEATRSRRPMPDAGCRMTDDADGRWRARRLGCHIWAGATNYKGLPCLLLAYRSAAPLGPPPPGGVPPRCPANSVVRRSQRLAARKLLPHQRQSLVARSTLVLFLCSTTRTSYGPMHHEVGAVMQDIMRQEVPF